MGFYQQRHKCRSCALIQSPRQSLQESGWVRNKDPLATHYTAKDLLKVPVLRRIDQGVHAIIEQNDDGRVGYKRAVVIYKQIERVRGEANTEAANNVEHVFSDFCLAVSRRWARLGRDRRPWVLLHGYFVLLTL